MRDEARLQLRRAARVSGFAAITGGFASAYAAHRSLARRETDPRLRDEWLRRWSDALLRLFAIDLTVVGEPPPPRAPNERGRLVVANHRSTIDIGLLLGVFGGRLVSRGDLAGWPVLGRAARTMGTIFVDRSSGPSGLHAMRAIGGALREGDSVGLFAEGTTFADDEVRPFLPGGFVAAITTRAEIVPVGLAYAEGAGAAFLDEPFATHLLRLASAPPSRVAMAIGEPLVLDGKPRAAELARAARDAVQAMVETARRAL